MNNLNNIILKSDSYKTSHAVQYPVGTERVYSYFESRVGAKWDETVFFGLQAYIKKFLLGRVIDSAKIRGAKQIIDAHMGPTIFNRAGWEYILKTYDGKLPLRIKAVPEGTPVSTSNALMTIENTDPKCFWLTNYIETLLVQTWYPSTVATLSREIKKIIKKYLEETGDTIDGLDFKLHDFGYRGVSSDESAGFGDMSHLVSFKGTDTMIGLVYAQEYYGAEMAGFSIPASEHSTITSWGQHHEVDAMRNMLNQYKDFQLFACVSDSWDIYNSCSNYWGLELRQEIINRGGGVVIRPDSGDPLIVLPKILNILDERFGSKVNSKGYKVLNYVSLIQGDGITYETIPLILEKIKQSGFSTANIAFGSGGGLLQNVNRDTQRFAFKCSSVVVNGVERDVYKNPTTDNTKASKKGRLSLVYDGGWNTVNESELGDMDDHLITVFENGDLITEYTFDQIRERACI